MILLALLLCLAGAAAADEPTAAPTTPSAAADYPPALRDVVISVTARPTFEKSSDGRMTWLRVDQGWPLAWDWPSQETDGPEWKERPSLASVLQLDPAVEYTFDVVWIDDCDDLIVEYPFKSDRAMLLRVRRGDTVIFDALQEASRRTGKPLSEVVRVAVHPTPAVVATKAPDPAGSALGSVLLQLLETKAVCESEATFTRRWSDSEKSLGAAAQTAEPLILLQQPLYETRVVVFVYDPQARGKRNVDVTLVTEDCPDYWYEPGQTVSLPALQYDAPLFVGTVDVEGVHGTAVKVRYRRAGAVYESALISMTYH